MEMRMDFAPELIVSDWINTTVPLSLAALRGKVVVIEAFQMLCPGCVSHGLPQASQIARTFSRDSVQVIGLHCVFEHHEIQGSKAALSAFNQEYGWPFPIAIDQPSQESAIPCTMAALGLRGTPSLVIIDRMGMVRHNHFGHVHDMLIGAQIAELIADADHLAALEKAPATSGVSDAGHACPT